MSSLDWAELVKDANTSGGGGFEPLPEGEYNLKVIKAEPTASRSGKTMFNLTTEVQGGAYNNRRIWDRLVISPESPAAMGFFFRKMAALGLTSEYFQSNPSNEQVAAALENRAFRGRVKQREYQGKLSNEIDAYAPAQQASGPVPPAPQAAAPAAPPVAPPQAVPAAPVAPPVQAAPPVTPPPTPAAPPAQESPWTSAPAAPPAPPASGSFPPAPPF